MTREDARRRLRAADTADRAGLAGTPLGEEIEASGVRFSAVGGSLEERWHSALSELGGGIRSLAGGPPVLLEGGAYPGCWLESTGTISNEVLGRFAPAIASDTLRLFAAHQREDGMLPYKVTADGPGFSQIQIVTPLARVVHRHARRTGDRALLETMYPAMVRYDAWLARYRDTLGTGGVEAFCTFDTGHDLSPRFWFAPDRAFGADARWCDPAASGVPYVAPDLTANVIAQRRALASIAQELGDDAEAWSAAAERSLAALYAQCFDPADEFFYDRDRNGAHVRVQSDVLLRVLACGIGDGAFFAAALRRYLMNTRRFLSHYGFTSVAMDDPRFDHDASRNSWGGPVNFLAQLRAPDAFEQHGHVAELAVAATPVLTALATADRFPQCLDPWSGDAGYTEGYTPSILWMLDAIERYFGVFVEPDGGLRFSGLTPTRLDHGAAASAVGYARTVDGVVWELVGDDETIDVHRDGEQAFAFPRGWRVETDAQGIPVAVVGLAPQTVAGALRTAAGSVELALAPNERVDLASGRRTRTEFVAPIL